MNTNQIRSTSIADLRAAYFAGKLTFDEVERERLRRVEEQKDIQFNEREMFSQCSHPQWRAIDPRVFAEDLPRRVSDYRNTSKR